jgi:aspartate/methionine/tyrosine aminotransferase
VISNPSNPSGALMDQALLEQVAAIADGCGAFLLCDEVYRGTDQDGTGTTASVVDVHARAISTASMSKAFSLAGLRLGWITAPTDVIDAIAMHRDYNTISVGMLDDLFASIALEHKEQILRRSRAIVRGNLAALDAWVAGEPRITYVKPRSGTTALLRYDLDLPSRDLCVRLLEETGVLLTPGSALDMEGYLRIGYANRADVLREGLHRLSRFLRSAL